MKIDKQRKEGSNVEKEKKFTPKAKLRIVGAFMVEREKQRRLTLQGRATLIVPPAGYKGQENLTQLGVARAKIQTIKVIWRWFLYPKTERNELQNRGGRGWRFRPGELPQLTASPVVGLCQKGEGSKKSLRCKIGKLAQMSFHSPSLSLQQAPSEKWKQDAKRKRQKNPWDSPVLSKPKGAAQF